MKVKASELVRCGYMVMGEECVIYYNPVDGSFIYRDENDCDWYYINEISAKGAHEIKDINSFIKAFSEGAYGNVMGVILANECVIVILDEITAERRPYYPAKEPTGDVIPICLDNACTDIEDDIDL